MSEPKPDAVDTDSSEAIGFAVGAAPNPWSKSILGGAVLAVFYLTLFPFDFTPGRGAGLDSFFVVDLDASYLYLDVPLNVALFIPLGYGLAGVIAAHRRVDVDVHQVEATLTKGGIASAVMIMVISSTAIELVQGWTLLRFPSIVDVISNGLGGGIGIGAFVAWGNRPTYTLTRLVDRLRTRTSVFGALVAVIIYTIVFVAATILIQPTTELSNWDLDQPLIVGNERTADRPWSGTMRRLYVLDRALDDAETEVVLADGPGGLDPAFVAFHDFASGVEAGFPQLEWLGVQANATDAGVRLGAQGWLATPGIAEELSRAIRAASELTVGVTVVPDDLDQFGPARLVSISDGLFVRNLTIGQESQDLVVRLRTPLTGSDGTDPEFVFADVFRPGVRHDIVVRYDGSTVSVDYTVESTDGVRSDVSGSHEVTLVPEFAVLRSTFPTDINGLRPHAFSKAVFFIVVRSLVFVPLAFAVWLSTLRGGRRHRTIALATSAVLSISIGLETAWTAGIETYRFRPQNVAYDLALLAGLIFIVEFRATRAATTPSWRRTVITGEAFDNP